MQGFLFRQSGLQYTGIILGVFLAGFIFGFTPGALAQDMPPAPSPPNSSDFLSAPASTSDSDPQARVGRISLISGTVSFHAPDQDSWSYATLNYPVVSGNSFWTEPASRAEIQVGSSALRMDGGTEVNIDELDDQGLRAEVSQGTLNLHVGAMVAGEAYQIATPHGTINVLQSGTYRITTGEGVPDEVAVLRGSAQVTQAGDPNDSLTVRAGETASVPLDKPSSVSMRETVPTPFDNWSLARDNYEEPRQVTHYVSPEMTGYEDLDNYGTWNTEPDYGAVWIPSAVPVGWAPYHYGHWVWVSPWGWTWIDEAPWGFAPFHYGRWAYVHNRWCWAPGIIARRPVYAPALVAFVGGNGWSISIGIGERPVGWFPLGPGEVYRPGYHVSSHYIRNVNISNVRDVTKITNVTNNYYNGRGPRANTANTSFANRRFATVVSAKDFAAARSVDKVALHVPADKLATAPINTTETPPVGHDRRATGNPVAPNPPHENDHNDNNHNDRNAGSDRNAGPSAPHAPTPPVVEKPNVERPVAEKSAVEKSTQPEMSSNVSPDRAPGPPIHRRDTTVSNNNNNQLSVHGTPGTPAAAQHDQTLNMQNRFPANARETAPRTVSNPVPTPAQRPAPREITVDRPAQKVPLVPSHEGWVRREQAAPPAAPQSAPPLPRGNGEHSSEQPHNEQLHGGQPQQGDHQGPGDQGRPNQGR